VCVPPVLKRKKAVQFKKLITDEELD